MNKKRKIIFGFMGLIVIIVLGLFLSNYLDPINTMDREKDVEGLIVVAENSDKNEQKRAISKLSTMDSLKTKYENGKAVHSRNQEKVVKSLIKIAGIDPNPLVKQEAIFALGHVWNDEAIIFLKNLSDNSSNELSSSAELALKQINSQISYEARNYELLNSVSNSN